MRRSDAMRRVVDSASASAHHGSTSSHSRSPRTRARPAVAVVRAADVVAGVVATPGLPLQLGQGPEVRPVEVQAVPPVGALDGLGADHGAGPAGVHGDLPGRSGRWVVAPQALDEAVDGHRSTVGEHQHLEQGAGLAAPQGREVAALDPELPQQPGAQADPCHPVQVHGPMVPHRASGRDGGRDGVGGRGSRLGPDGHRR